jgi:hypothetical protein
MAMPIKETPVLEGEHAEKFLSHVEKNRKRVVSKKEYKAAENIFLKIMEKQPL